MNAEELLAAITELPVLERVPLLDALMNLRIITVYEAADALSVKPATRVAKKAGSTYTTGVATKKAAVKKAVSK